jgi:hypothetical protein
MWQALRRLIVANPMGVFLYSIIAKWYVMVAIASLVVLFWVARGLEQIGFVNYITKSTVEILDISKSIAQNCTTKLGPRFENLVDFWNCLGNPPKYQVRDDLTKEKALEDGLNKLIYDKHKQLRDDELNNPYNSSNSSTNDDRKNK